MKDRDIDKGADIIAMLRELLPDLEVPSDPAEGVYCNAGDFAIWLRDGVVDKSLPEEKVDRAFAALNRIGSVDDDEIQNQLAVGVLEILIDDPASVSAARQKLEGRALELFENMKELWHGPEAKNA